MKPFQNGFKILSAGRVDHDLYGTALPEAVVALDRSRGWAQVEQRRCEDGSHARARVISVFDLRVTVMQGTRSGEPVSLSVQADLGIPSNGTPLVLAYFAL